jgi:hypothetical protein
MNNSYFSPTYKSKAYIITTAIISYLAAIGFLKVFNLVFYFGFLRRQLIFKDPELLEKGHSLDTLQHAELYSLLTGALLGFLFWVVINIFFKYVRLEA